MTRVSVSVERTELEDDKGRMISGIIVGCDECSAHVSVYGTSIRSVKRGCVMLKEQCGEGNFYVYEGDEFDD